MKSMIDILGHPYLITNRLAEAIYDDSGNAVNQRLRSRIKGRHNFTVQDYKAARKVVLGFSRQLDRIANKIEQANPTEKNPNPNWFKLMFHPWINHKTVLTEVGKSYELSYYRLYDRMRDRVALPKGFSNSLAQEYRRFAQWIRDQLDQAKAEQKTYAFSVGRGGASHRGEEQK